MRRLRWTLHFIAAGEFWSSRERAPMLSVALRTVNCSARAGGVPVMSDRGAGSRIKLLALRAIFHAMDASEETSLLPALHAAWETQTVEELEDLGNRIPMVEFSQLAPLVAQCAADGDVVARRVLQQSGEELADLVLLAIGKGTALETRAHPDAPTCVHPSPGSIVAGAKRLHACVPLRSGMIAPITLRVKQQEDLAP